MLIFGTQIHLIAFIFITLELMMFSYQLFHFLSRPQDRRRFWYLLLLVVMLLFNLAGGSFPNAVQPIYFSVHTIATYSAGLLMAAYFPFYFHRAFDLSALRWHVRYGVRIFLIIPYLIYFGQNISLNGKLNTALRYSMALPFLYATILLAAICRAIRRKHLADRLQGQYFEEIASYLAITPWASLIAFGILQVSEEVKILATNCGVVLISFLFIGRAVKRARYEYDQLIAYGMTGIDPKILNEKSDRYRLTKRQIEIALLIRKGLTYREIADALFISEKTVSNHIQNVYEKTGAANKVQLLQKLADRY